MTNWQIRSFRKEDLLELQQLFYDTVHQINKEHYSQIQLKIWAPEEFITYSWKDRVTEDNTWVATHNESLVGFITCTTEGYIDFLFTHYQFQGQGIATMLMSYVFTWARHLGLSNLSTQASITAKPFFAKMGFSVNHPNTVVKGDITFQNFVMSRTLH